MNATSIQDTSANKGLRNFGYAILTIITLIGLYAIFVRFKEGLMVTNMTQNVPWGFWVAFYIYFIGLSAGSFLLSTLIYVFKMEQYEKAGKLALIQALLCMLMAVWLIFIDLGHPSRAYRVLTNWHSTSVLAWEAMFYGLYIVVIIAELYYVMRADFHFMKTGSPLSTDLVAEGKKWLMILGIIGIPVAIGVHGGTGALFAVAKARPGWFSGLFPIIFLVSALASGGGLLAFITSLTSKLPQPEKLKLVKSLMSLTVGVIAFDMLLFTSEIFITFYGGISHEVKSWTLTIFGPNWPVFWFVQVGLGMLAPILIVANKNTSSSIKWLGFAGLCVVVGIIGTRLNIVIPPQITPTFDTLPEANHHFRFSYGYFPSINEWLVAIGSISLIIWAFIYSLKKFPVNTLHNTK
ncbi:MAG: hypothetical protein A3H98_08365 [Bacteroidetes bacterium RIFCSPLOWO2_02_FULL_36_8]|nr:MAG: hypothetical protein A3H98_08365 [Bacteroidetes bacterium RIFCSPLOWO2_02_FULL_36_8]OFY68852.1 MAG: hypothetical protein A3G23_03440 [Bacteroidetes bacterium RIFCSPLOWO2_12_FULL_37_12]